MMSKAHPWYPVIHIEMGPNIRSGVGGCTTREAGIPPSGCRPWNEPSSWDIERPSKDGPWRCWKCTGWVGCPWWTTSIRRRPWFGGMASSSPAALGSSRRVGFLLALHKAAIEMIIAIPANMKAIIDMTIWTSWNKQVLLANTLISSRYHKLLLTGFIISTQRHWVSGDKISRGP